MDFYEFDQKLERRRLVIYVLEQNGYNPDDFNIDFLIEAGVLQKMGDWAKEKGKKFTLPMALAAGMSGFGGGMSPQSADAAIRQSTPSAQQSTTIRQVTPSKANSLTNLFSPGLGGTLVPKQGNGILVKSVTSVNNDELQGDVNDFTVYNQDTSGAVNVKSKGSGLTWEEAVKDALRQAGGQALGTHIDAQTVVKNDELEKDSVVASGAAVVHNFKITDYQQNGGIFEVSVDASVSKPSGKFSGAEGHYKVSDTGQVTKYKDVIGR